MKKVIMFMSLILVAVIGFKINIDAYSYEISPNTYTGTVNVDNEFKITYDLATFTSITGRQVIEELFGMVADPSEVATAIYDMPLSSVYISTTAEYLAYTNVDLMIIKVYTSAPSYLLNVDINLFDDTGLKIVTKTYTNGLQEGFQLLAQSYGPNEPSGSYQGGYIDGYNDGLNNVDNNQANYNDGYTDGYNDGTAIDTDVRPLFQTLISFIGSVFMLTIFPGVTIGVLVSIPISFALFKWFMKMFGGK